MMFAIVKFNCRFANNRVSNKKEVVLFPTLLYCFVNIIIVLSMEIKAHQDSLHILINENTLLATLMSSP